MLDKQTVGNETITSKSEGLFSGDDDFDEGKRQQQGEEQQGNHRLAQRGSDESELDFEDRDQNQGGHYPRRVRSVAAGVEPTLHRRRMIRRDRLHRSIQESDKREEDEVHQSQGEKLRQKQGRSGKDETKTHEGCPG